MIGSAWEKPELLDLIGEVYRVSGPANFTGQPITLPDGDTYEIDWGEDELPRQVA